MFTIYKLKPAFQNILRPITKSLYKAKITANQVTILACVLSVCLGLILTVKLPYKVNHNYWLIIVPVFQFVRMALNAIDGMLAREFNQKSNLGAILNEITDVTSDSALYLPFALVLNPFLVVLIVVLSIISEMIGVVGAAIGSSRRYDGPMGKSDRAFFFGIVAILLYFIRLSNTLNNIISIVLAIVLLLLIITIYNRGKNSLIELKNKTT